MSVGAAFLSSYVLSSSVPSVLVERLVRVFSNGGSELTGAQLVKLYSIFSPQYKNSADRFRLLLALADCVPDKHPLSRLESFVNLCEGKNTQSTNKGPNSDYFFYYFNYLLLIS